MSFTIRDSFTGTKQKNGRSHIFSQNALFTCVPFLHKHLKNQVMVHMTTNPDLNFDLVNPQSVFILGKLFLDSTSKL